jgi:hypothetical protein
MNENPNWIKKIISWIFPQKKGPTYYRLEGVEADPVRVSYNDIPPVLPQQDKVEPEENDPREKPVTYVVNVLPFTDSEKKKKKKQVTPVKKNSKKKSVKK